jgi:hypothetical protein
MKMYGRVAVAPPFLTPARNKSEWPASSPCDYSNGETAPVPIKYKEFTVTEVELQSHLFSNVTQRDEIIVTNAKKLVNIFLYAPKVKEVAKSRKSFLKRHIHDYTFTPKVVSVSKRK